MIPVLFKGNETNFNHNGIGLLKDTLSCEVTEVRNGSFDLELVYPITGPYFKDLKNGNIIQAKPNDTDPPHNFRINEIDKTLSDKEITVYATSITNDLGGNMVKSLYLADVTPQVIFNEMKKILHYPTSFNFVSNITTVGTIDWKLNNPLNLIVGEEGSLVDIFGGEVKRTNDSIFLYGRRGKDNVTTIRAGKNLEGFKMTESFQGKYTQILPYFKYEEEIQGDTASDGKYSGETTRQEVTIFGDIVTSQYHGRYPVNSIRPIDFSNNDRVREAKTLEVLNNEAARYFKNLYSEIDKPSININVDMVQLVDTEQYELYERLEKKELTDTVSVYVPEYEVDVLVKITELKYDSLRERTISIVAGSSSGRTSLMDEISGSYKQFTTNLVNDKIQSATAGIVNNILTQKNGVNMFAGRATPPDSAKSGDIWFKDVGGGDVELYEFNGVDWVRKMHKGFGDDVRKMVDEKIAESNATFTEAIDNHEKIVAEAMTKAGQANDLAEQAKINADNASLSAFRANQDIQDALEDLESTKTRVDITEKSITSIVSGSKLLPDGRTNVFVTKMESLEGAINQRVTTQELNNRLPDNMGGRNLVRGSADLKQGGKWSDGTWRNSGGGGRTEFNVTLPSSPIKGITHGVRIYSTNTQQWGICQDGTIISPGVYTFSVWVKGSAGLKIKISAAFSQDTTNNPYGSGDKDVILTNSEWTRISQTFTITKFYNSMSLAYFFVCSPGDAYFAAPYIHMSSIPGDWSPAPEDHDASLADKLSGYVTNQTYTTYTADRQQTDRQITEQINQTVSKVPTGPVNLIVNGFDPQKISPWTSGGTGNSLVMATHDFFYKSQKKLYILSTSNTNEALAWTNIFNLKRNSKYTLRVGLFANSATTSCDIFFMGKPAGGIFAYQHKLLINDLSRSKVVYYTITFDSGSFDYGQIRIDNNGSTTQGTKADLYICEVSCIEGEFNNSWTPSIDELITEQKFNETKSTVDAFSRAIGTREENGIIPNIARLVMTQDVVISEVAKYGDHNNNLIIDATNHSQTESIGGATLFRYPQYDRIDFRRTDATEKVWAGIECKLNTSRIITGEKYTVSFEYYLHSKPDSDLVLELKDEATFLAGGWGFASPSTATGRWHKHTHTFSIINDSKPNSNKIRFKIWVGKNAYVAIQKIMFVRGEKIGPFSTSQVDSVTTRVEQTASSYAIKFLNSANDITSQLNMTSSGTRIKSSLIHLDGNVTVSGQAWMDGAVIKNLSADKINTGTLNANNVRITNLSVNDISGINATFLQSIIGTAFIDWMKGKVIQGYNNNMTIDLLGGNITLNNGNNAIKRVKGTHTAFVHFNDVSSKSDSGVGSLYAAIGVTSSGDGVNSQSSGRFAGLRAFRGANGTSTLATVDQVEIYGDRIYFGDDFSLDRGFQVRPVHLSKTYDLNDDILNPIRFVARVMVHLNNVGWNWKDGALLDSLLNEWNSLGMNQYAKFRNNTLYKP